MSSELLQMLSEHAKTGAYALHMPGHKRNTAMLGNALPYALDITEIPGFDDLHAPSGVLRRLEEQLAALWGARQSFALVNGATSGILAGIASLVSPGDTVLLARNCHRSVYHALALTGAVPVYLAPPVDAQSGIAGSISPRQVEAALAKNPQTKLVVVTSPTYDGVLSDLAGIVRAAHSRHIAVLVDEAHGAHLAFTENAGSSAVRAGADVVIHSLHKTLPALTQCAAAHLCGPFGSAERFRRALAVFETSSPSYLLLASVAECADFLKTHGAAAFAAYGAHLDAFSEACGALARLYIPGKGRDARESHPAFFALDGGKLPVVTARTTLDGAGLARTLRRDFALESEMAAVSYTLLMTSVCDTKEAFTRLSDALLAIDRTAKPIENPPVFSPLPLPERRLTPQAAAGKAGALCPLEAAAGKTSLETVFCYPPGTPLLVAGEVVDEAVLRRVQNAAAHGLAVRSSRGKLPQIAVCD